MIIFSNLSETCSLVFNDFAATSASRLDEKGPAITWNPFFFPGVRRMKPSLLCFLTLSSIFSALRKLGKVPTKRPYFLSSFRGAIGCSFAAGRLMAVFGGFVSEVPTPSLGGGVVRVEAQSGLLRAGVCSALRNRQVMSVAFLLICLLELELACCHKNDIGSARGELINLAAKLPVLILSKPFCSKRSQPFNQRLCGNLGPAIQTGF